MQADALNTVLNLSSAVQCLSSATEHATGEERRRVHSTISRLLQVIDDITGKPAVSADSPIVLGMDPAVLGGDYTAQAVIAAGIEPVREIPAAPHHVHVEAPAKTCSAPSADVELAALFAVVNEREDAKHLDDEPPAEPELRALGIPQGLRIALRQAGICDRNQLLALNWRQLSDLPGVGLAGASIIRRKVASAGYALAIEELPQDDLVRSEPNPSTLDLRIHPELRLRLNDLRIYDLDGLCRLGRAALVDDLLIGELGAAALAQKARNFGRELAA